VTARLELAAPRDASTGAPFREQPVIVLTKSKCGTPIESAAVLARHLCGRCRFRVYEISNDSAASMPFKFSHLCELLEELQRQRFQQRATYSKQDDPSYRIVVAWYNKHADDIRRSGPSAVAFLSALLPERRPDRTYNLQPKRLSQIFARVLGVGASRLRLLQSWQEARGPDFPTCVERVMAESEFDLPNASNEVTLEQIDEVLTQIAANSMASSPAIQAQRNNRAPCDLLAPIIRRLRSAEAKWLTRMILKSYSPVIMPEYVVLHHFHFMLPKLLELQNSFEAAIATLTRPAIAPLPPRPSKEYQAALLPIVAKEIIPQLGVMIRKQHLEKARSIKHCVKLAGSRTMSVERKYDGEYCQIHIDKSKGARCIQIFSKSGKDSTQDRRALHSAIRAGLKLDMPDCKIKERAIIEGELLVYSMTQKMILPFCNIRKHVLHGGRRIGTEADSPKQSGEQAMIVFFDVLLLDGKFMINEPHSNRRAHLKALVSPIEGRTQLVERQMIDFESRNASSVLRDVFAVAIRRRWEGFVLKGLDDPYFSWKEGMRGIKLKKDYIAGLGDTADLCVVGGRRDPRDELSLQLGRLSWTCFYVACLLNKEDVRRYDARPSLKIVDCLGIGSLSKQDMLALNAEGKLVEQKFVSDSEFMAISHPRRDIPLPSEMFKKPIVVEVMGAGYERPQTVDFYTLRFPRRVGGKIKLHKDRDVADTVGFDELQNLAHSSLKEDAETASQEDAAWIGRLLDADPASKYALDKSQSTSPTKTLYSATTMDLTPVGTRQASTQQPPSLVRIDSDELTLKEFQHRYPSSAPQTPSRQSETTLSPASTARTTASKRKFNAAEEPLISSPIRKKKRVEFCATVDVRQVTPDRTLSDITDVAANRTSARSSLTKTKGPTVAVTTVASPQQQQERQELQAAAATNTSERGPLPTPSSIAEAASESEQASEVTMGPRRSSSGVTNTLPPASAPAEQIAPRVIGGSGGVPDLAACFRRSVYITPSLVKHKHIIQYLKRAELDFTFSIGRFIDSLFTSMPEEKRIILVDALKSNDTIADIQWLSRSLQLSEHRKRANDLGQRSSILILDFHVLHTGYAKSGFAKCDLTMFEVCEQYFCGVLELVKHAGPGLQIGLRPKWDSRFSEALLGR